MGNKCRNNEKVPEEPARNQASNLITCLIVSTVALTPNGIIQRGCACPIFTLKTTGKSGASMVSRRIFFSTFISTLVVDFAVVLTRCYKIIIFRFYNTVLASLMKSNRREAP